MCNRPAVICQQACLSELFGTRPVVTTVPETASLALLQEAIPAALRLQHVEAEFSRATCSDVLTLNEWILYWASELAAVLPIGRGVFNPKGRKLAVRAARRHPTSALRIGARPCVAA